MTKGKGKKDRGLKIRTKTMNNLMRTKIEEAESDRKRDGKDKRKRNERKRSKKERKKDNKWMKSYL